MRRILHIGPFIDESRGQKLHRELLALHPQPGLRAALREHGEVRSISWPQVLYGAGPDALQWAILGAMHDWKPDWVFMQAHQDVIDDDTLAEIPGKVFSWCGDVREPLPEHYLKRAKFVDITSFSNDEDVETVRAAGHRAEYLQVGFDAEVYWPGPQEGRHGIVFLGNNYGDRFPLSGERFAMVEALRAKFGRRFRLYGNGWPKALGAHPPVHGEAEANVLRRAKVAVCQNHFERSRYTSDRTFRSMGCGALVLQRGFPGFREELGDGNVVIWKDFRDLCGAIDLYCSEDAERSRIAGYGADYAHEHCTWQARMREWAASMRGE